MKKPQPKYQFNYPTRPKDAYLQALLQAHMDLLQAQQAHHTHWLTQSKHYATVASHTA
jgi:hypothetical protein